MRKILADLAHSASKKNAFSLMEMMIVLLIIAIVAAATAPMVTKKMARNAATASGAIEYFGLGNNFGNQGDGTFFLGDTNAHGLNNNDIKMYINSNTNTQPQIGFGANGNPTGVLSVLPTGRIALGSSSGGIGAHLPEVTADNSIAIGANTTAGFAGYNNIEDVIAIGNGAQASAGDAIAIGSEAKAGVITSVTNGLRAGSSIAIGNIALAGYDSSIAMGQNSLARSDMSIALGYKAKAGDSGKTTYVENSRTVFLDNTNSIAIGNDARSLAPYSVAIATKANAHGIGSIAIGDNAVAARNVYTNSSGFDHASGAANWSTSIGTDSRATLDGATALGGGARANAKHSIAIGNGDPNANAGAYKSETLGSSPWTNGQFAIAMGTGAKAGSAQTIAIGLNAQAGAGDAIAIGQNTRADVVTTDGAGSGIAIGLNATAEQHASIAIGKDAHATAKNSVAIGIDIVNPRANVIQLGGPNQTVYIPGNLVVGRKTVLGLEDDNTYSCVLMREAQRGSVGSSHDGSASSHDLIKFAYAPGNDEQELRAVDENGDEYIPGFGNVRFHNSDRRLKNVGEVFKGGLEELKKLDLYNYTFKKDEKKTPHVGVMAQDLQKVFPNAAWEGEDGYLRIRWDEMFYAVINAVKELDTKITTVFEQIKSNTDKIAKLQAQVDEQQKAIDDLSAQIDKQNKEFEKRLAKLEKRTK